ncbi:MAG: hypothetical protein QOI11_3413 [Candidatus Eremiobacteraeota bacterium]|nr:hypothetical protein [Candidatus Eremiobacteraeota bacterium]
MPIPLVNDMRNVGIVYHAQDDTTLCGAAVAQMLLGPIEHTSNLRSALDLQSDLALENLINDSRGDSLGASVEALSATLNGRGKPFQAAFTSKVTLSPDPFAVAVDAVIGTGYGVAALVAGGGHWVVLNGVASDPAEEGKTGLYVHDPHSDVPPKGLHSDDDHCGKAEGLGSPNIFVTREGMGAFYLPTALILAAGSPVEPSPPEQPMVFEAVNPPTVRQAEPFDPLEMAAVGIHAAGIVQRGPLSATLRGSRPTRGVRANDYWHVTLEVESQVIGYALLALGDGKLLAVMANGKERPLMNLSAEALLPELYANADAIRLADSDFMRALEQRPRDVRATFFWRLCREAPSPSHPLVRISIGTKVLYRDHFGAFHARLQLLDR